MCLAAPGKVVSLDQKQMLAEVEYFGSLRKVSTLLVPDVKTGDWVIVHAGEVIEIVDEESAAESIRTWKEIYSDGELG